MVAAAMIDRLRPSQANHFDLGFRSEKGGVEVAEGRKYSVFVRFN